MASAVAAQVTPSDRPARAASSPLEPNGARLFFRLALAATIGTYLLIVAGATVRVTGSGLGCPDWPTCHGRLVPPLETAALIEYTHRLLGAIVTPLILAIPVAAAVLRRGRVVLVPALLIPALLALQIGLGAVVVWLELPPMAVLVHLGFAMVILGGLVWITTQALPAAALGARASRTPSTATDRHYLTLLRCTTGAILFLVLTGAYTRASGASWACIGFPGCTVPETAVAAAEAAGAGGLVHIHLFHRGVAYLTTVLAVAAVAETWRLRGHVPALRLAAAAFALALVTQLSVGAAAVSFGLPTFLRGAHVAGAAAVWALGVLLLGLATRAGSASTFAGGPPRAAGAAAGPAAHPASSASPPAAAPSTSEASRRSGWAKTVRAYVSLTKPKVILLLEVPTLAAMLVAGEALPSPLLVAATLLGGALAAGGAAAINCYLDRDVDALMGERTQRRAIPSGAIGAGAALAFGLTLAVASFVVLIVFANWLAAALAQVALLFYVFVYTRWLKRSTPSNIVIGGAAGAMPPLVGWAAVTGELGPLAWLLFAIIFFWTPPHFWALSLIIRQHYERANIPMLPVVRGDRETRRQIVYYTVQMICVTLLLFALQLGGTFYLGAALLLGAVFLYLAARLYLDATIAAASRLFHYSMLYLWLLSIALVVDKRVFV